LNNTDPKLGPLADNGGPTPTHALIGSPAIDAADSSSCPSTDQRGAPRPSGLACDIGAYELVGASGMVVMPGGPGGVKQVRFLTRPNHIYQIQAATNLSVWETISFIPSNGNGVYDFYDTNSLNYTCRFYRIPTP
jgi:hypothetical protein